jgi:PAS domain S-box-containing protein
LDTFGEVAGCAVTIQDITRQMENERAVRESEQRFKSLYLSMSEGLANHEIVYIDEKAADYIITDANPAFERITGLDRTSSVGKKASILYGTGSPPFLDIYARVAESGVPEYFETPFPPMKKHFAISVFSPGKGKFATVFADITERKQVEEALAAESTATALLQKITARFVRAGELEDALGEIVDAAIAMTHADMGNIQLLQPESVCLKIAAYRGFEEPFLNFWNAVAGGQGNCGTAIKKAERSIVEDVTKSDILVGTPSLKVQLDAGVRAVQSTPLISHSGTLIGMLSTHWRVPHRPQQRELDLLDLLVQEAVDIIELARAEDALRESEERFKAIAETTPVGIGVVGLSEATFLYVNPAYVKSFGYTESEILGKGVQDIYWSIEDRDRVLGILKKEGNVAEYEVKLKRKDGAPFWGLSSVRPITYGGRPALLGAFVDITERRRAEDEVKRHAEELKAANEELVRFNRAMVDRELRMIELKKQVNELCGKMGMEPMYKVGKEQ